MTLIRSQEAAGKTIRQGRIFGRDNRTVIVALDHGVTGVNTLGGLTNPAALIHEVAPYVDSLLVTPGILRAYAGSFDRTGIIMRLDGGPTSATGKFDRICPMISVEDAVRLGADGVAAMGLIGTKNEDESLRELARLAADCDRLGVPLLAEMLPRGLTAEKVDTDEIAVAARVGAEIGADIIKVAYQGTPGEFRQVTQECYRPVVVLGGAKKEGGDFAASIVEAMHAGASGVAIGRNVWRHPRPGEVAKQLHGIVHEARSG